MKFEIIKWESLLDFHRCIDEDGQSHQVDLFINGDLDESITAEELVGKTVSVERLTPYLELAHGVKILKGE